MLASSAHHATHAAAAAPATRPRPPVNGTGPSCSFLRASQASQEALDTLRKLMLFGGVGVYAELRLAPRERVAEARLACCSRAPAPRGDRINQRNAAGHTPLHVAVEHRATRARGSAA